MARVPLLLLLATLALVAALVTAQVGAEGPIDPLSPQPPDVGGPVPPHGANEHAAAGAAAADAAAAAPGASSGSGSRDFLPAFVSGVSMIVVSELGDKTFFIAAIMAMKHNRITVFVSAMAALGLMTVLSAAMGFALPALLPRRYTQIGATVLFLFFGIKLLKDGWEHQEGEPNEELEEVEQELGKKELESAENDMEMGALTVGSRSPSGNSTGNSERAASPPAAANHDHPDSDREGKHPRRRPATDKCFSPIFIQVFTMNFLAEWGDRSQIATIALAAAQDPVGVTVGGILGHSLTTGLAVLGGKLLATRISEKTVSYVGGVLFLFFALHSIFTNFL